MYVILVGMMILLFLILILKAFGLYRKETNEVFIQQVGEDKFNVYLSRDAYQKLKKLRKATNRDTLEETIRDAMKLYEDILCDEGREK